MAKFKDELLGRLGEWIEYYLYKCGLIFYFGSPDPPPQPDYIGAARAQGAANVETALTEGRINNPNVITPYGEQNVTWDGEQPTVTQTFSPEQQTLFDTENRIKSYLGDIGEAGIGRVGDAMAAPWDTSGAPKVTAYSDMDNSNQVAEALRDRYMPDILKRRQQGMDDLLIQGHTRGGQAWDTAARDYDRTENDFVLASIVAAENERRANNEQQYGMETADRGRYISEQAFDRNVPLNEVNALRTGNQATPYNYQPYQGTNIQPTPLFDATLASGNFAQNQYGQDLGAYNNMMSGLFSLGGAGLGAYGARG